jgi:hypothetical protein
MDRQLRLHDLVPPRWLLGIFLLAAAGAAAGLEISYCWMMERAAAGGKIIAALDISAKGSLACWLSSMALLAASFAAILVYGVRRHRTDDYQGKYRIWTWVSIGLLLMATDQAASLREGFRDLMIAATGMTLSGDGTLWWVGFYALAWLALGSRVLLDMRPSVLSMGSFVAATIAHALVMADRMGWIFTGSGMREVLVRSGCEMAGNFLLLAAMGFHARYVLLDAYGLLPLRERKQKEPKPSESTKDKPPEKEVIHSAGDGRWLKFDPPHETPKPATPREVPASTPATISAAKASPSISAPATDSSAQHKLSKVERKALKEKLLRERQEREKRAW